MPLLAPAADGQQDPEPDLLALIADLRDALDRLEAAITST